MIPDGKLIACWITLESAPWCFYLADRNVLAASFQHSGILESNSQASGGMVRRPIRWISLESHTVIQDRDGHSVDSLGYIYCIILYINSAWISTMDDQWWSMMINDAWPYPPTPCFDHGANVTNNLVGQDIARGHILSHATTKSWWWTGRPCFFQFPGESQRNQRRNWRGLVHENWQ